jgi:two-component system, cell cycle sensor histidine kinase and response regulator CckA
MNNTAILIVEDEAIVAADLENKLRQNGYEVGGIASQGLAAVELAQRLCPQLILMDIQLEGPLDGIEAAEMIHRQSDIPVVFLTAHSDRPTLARAKLTGPFGYILKPFDDRELVTQIELALYKYNAERQLREQGELLRVTLSSIGEAVITTNEAGLITFINPVAESLSGWPMDQAASKPLEEVFRILDEKTREVIEYPIEDVLQTGERVDMSNHILLHGRYGGEVPVNCSGDPILDEKGKIRGVVLVFRDITKRRRAEEEKDAIIADLKQAIDKIRTLSGLLPICASCKKIRDDKGYWNQIEAYIRKHSEAEFTHGICPDCAKKLYPTLRIDDD